MDIQATTSNNEYLNISFLGFSGGERHVQLAQQNPENVQEVNLKARVQSSQDAIDLLLAANALQHRYGEDLKINMTLPYLPYARQDRVCAQGQAFSLEVFATLLKTMKLNSLTVWDCHSQIGLELTGASNVTAQQIIAASPTLVAELTGTNSILVCPDKGAIDRCLAIKEAFNLDSMVQCFKVRDPNTGRITRTEVDCQTLEGKTAIITDDICDGGFTFIKIAEQLKAKGAERVVLYVTHGIFSKGLKVFDGLIERIFTSNSFASQVDYSDLEVINFDK